MDQDSQSCIEANEIGWKLTCSNDVEDVNEEEPPYDEENLQDGDIQHTRLNAKPYCENKPRPDTEAVYASDSQHTQLDAQACCDKKPHPATEALYNNEPSRDVVARCKDGLNLESRSGF